MHSEDKYEGATEPAGDPRWLEAHYNAITMQIWDNKDTIRDELFLNTGV